MGTKRKQQVGIFVYCTEKERDRIKRAAERARQSVTQYVMDCLMDCIQHEEAKLRKNAS